MDIIFCEVSQGERMKVETLEGVLKTLLLCFLFRPFALAHLAKYDIHPGITLVVPGDNDGYQPSPAQPSWSTCPPPWPPRLLAEALITEPIFAEISTILRARFCTVRRDGAALSSEKSQGRGIHSL